MGYTGKKIEFCKTFFSFMYQWWCTGIRRQKILFFYSPLIKSSSSFLSTPLIKNSYTFHFFQLHSKKFVYKNLGHCFGAEQLPDQMFG